MGDLVRLCDQCGTAIPANDLCFPLTLTNNFLVEGHMCSWQCAQEFLTELRIANAKADAVLDERARVESKRRRWFGR